MVLVSEQYRELLKVTGGKERIRHYAQTESMTDISDEDIVSLHRLKTVRAELCYPFCDLRPGG